MFRAILPCGVLRLVSLIVLVCLAAPAAVQEDTTELPWALREKFKIDGDTVSFAYAADSGEWKLAVEPLGDVVESAVSEVVLGDGRVLRLKDIAGGVGDLDSLTNEFGEALEYKAQLPATESLVLQHSITRHKLRPFFLLRLRIENAGDAPVVVERISPAIFTLKGLSYDTVAGKRNLVVRGPFVVPGPGPRANFAAFHDVEHDFTLALGALPMRRADSSLLVEQREGGWDVQFHSDFLPPVTLAPGKSIESDPVWISFSLPNPADVDMFYSWSHSVLPKPEFNEDIPAAWVTVDTGASLAELLRVAAAWSGTGVSHALIPQGWEGEPGSLHGARPGYPRNMSAAADALRQAGMAPGITVDPLLSDDGSGAWTAETASGQHWLHPLDQEAQRHGVEQLRTLVKDGFEFFAVAKSLIPDEALTKFGCTRMQADLAAFRMMVEAAGGRPVAPTSELTLKGDLDAWLTASSTTSRLTEYGATPGPVRLDVESVKNIDETLATAIMFYGGPVELLGEGSPSVRKTLGSAMQPDFAASRPMSFSRSPRLWNVMMRAGDKSVDSEHVLMFPDAPAWKCSDLGFDGAARAWRAEHGAFVACSDPVKNGQDLSFAVVVKEFDRPVLLGVPEHNGFGFDAFRGVTWNAAAKTLSGSYTGAGANATIAVPPGWRIAKAKAGGRPVRGDGEQGVVSFHVEGSTQFEFQFE